MITLPRTQTSLSLDENVRAKEGGKETKGEMYRSHGNLRFSPVTRVCRSPLSLVIHSHHNLHNLYLFFLLFLLLSSDYPDVEPLLEDYELKGDKSKPYSVHLSPEDHRHA